VNLPPFLRGAPTIARQEFLGNLKSVRMIIMVSLLSLAVVGGAYGLGAGTGGFSGLGPIVVWGHPAYAENGSHVAVVWLSDPFGAPYADRQVEFTEAEIGQTVIGRVRTDGDGFARLDVGNRRIVNVAGRTGTSEAGTVIVFSPVIENFTIATYSADTDEDNWVDDLGVHVLNVTGDPVSARILVNGTYEADVDPRGYGHVVLPEFEGSVDLTVEVAGEGQTQQVYVYEDPLGSLFGTPDATLFLIAAIFMTLIVPIFAIVITFDAVSKEKVQGTLDLLLSRPVSRTGVLIGKFLGAFGAVAFPLTLVNLAAIGVLSATSGESPTGSFAAAFLGYSLVLVAMYVLLQLIFSSIAKTSGTAVLFGVLVWLLFNVLYNVITLMISLAISDPAARFQFGLYSGLGSPSAIYSSLIVLAFPGDFGGLFGGTTLGADVLGAAAVAWLVGLFALALWTFHRKAAE